MCADLAVNSNTAVLALCRNKMTGEIESEEAIPAGISFEQYLADYVPACTADNVNLFSVARNGQPWPRDQWHQLIVAGDHIVVTVEPQGAEVVYIAVALASAYYSYRMSQQIPDNYSSTTPSSSSVYSVNAQGNQPKLMGKVPRLYGKAPFVPYYLSKPRREYVTDENGTVEVLYLLFHLTKGELDADNTTWYIGETPTTSLPSNITTRIHAPGADLSDDPAHLVQFSSDEVADTELPGPYYAQEWPVKDGADYFAWGIYLDDATRLTMAKFTYAAGTGTITLDESGIDWLQYLNTDLPSYGDAIGHVFEMYGTASNNGLYRLVSNASDDPVWQKLNDDLTDDTSWTGFVSEGELPGVAEKAFVARWRLWGDEIATGYLTREWVGGYSGTPSSQTSQKYRLDFRYTGGLCKYNSSGNIESLSVNMVISYRDVDSDTWTDVYVTHTGETANELIITETIETTSATRLIFRVSYLSGGRSTSYRDDCQWVALRSEMPSPTSYPGWTVGTMIIEGAAELSDLAEGKAWLESCAVLPELAADENGEPYWTEPKPTRQRAAVIGQVHRDHGFSDSMLGMHRLLEIQQNAWDVWGDTFDYYEDDKATYWDKLTRYLAVGLCTPTLDYGVVTPVLDEAQSGYAQVFGRSNVTAGNGITMEISHSRGATDEKDGIEVEWMNPLTRKSATVTCTIGDDAAGNTEKVVAYGCIREEQAEFYGLYKRAVAKYRRRSLKWGTDMRGFASRYGDRVGVAPSFPGYSQSGRITAVNGNVVTLSWSPNWSLENQLTIERPDGTGYGPVVVTQGGAPNEVVLPAGLDWEPEFSGRVLEPMATFGRIIPALIQSAKPNDMQTASIEAVMDDPRVDAYRVPDWVS